jgi:hypothetical protein
VKRQAFEESSYYGNNFAYSAYVEMQRSLHFFMICWYVGHHNSSKLILNKTGNGAKTLAFPLKCIKLLSLSICILDFIRNTSISGSLSVHWLRSAPSKGFNRVVRFLPFIKYCKEIQFQERWIPLKCRAVGKAKINQFTLMNIHHLQK